MGLRLMLLVGAAVTACACGRIGFEPTSDGDLPAEADAGLPEINPASPEWTDLGTSATGGGVSQAETALRTVNVAASPTGEAVMAWADQRNGNMEIYVAIFRDGSWQALGSSLDSGGISNDPGESILGAVAFLDGRPTVLWRSTANADGTGARSMLLRHWDGNQWIGLGGSETGLGIALGYNAWWPSLIVDSEGRLVAVWEVFGFPGNNGGVIVGRRYENGTWNEIGESASGSGISRAIGDAHHAHAVAGPNGTLFVSWVDDRVDPGNAHENVYVSQWTGSAWVELDGSASGGGVSASDVNASRCALTLDGRGRPLVTWINDEGGPTETIFVKRWNGSTWESLGTSTSDEGIAGSYRPAANPSIAMNMDDEPVVVWQYKGGTADNIFATKWNGSQWLHLVNNAGGISGTTTDSSWPTFDVDRVSGALMAGWSETLPSGNNQAYMRVLR